LGKTAVTVDSEKDHVGTDVPQPVLALETLAAWPMGLPGDLVADLYGTDHLAYSDNFAAKLVPHYLGKILHRPRSPAVPSVNMSIGAAYCCGFYFYQHIPRPRRRNQVFFKNGSRAGFFLYNGLHGFRYVAPGPTHPA